MPRQIQSIPMTFANTGIVLKSTPDEIPLTSYMALVNVYTDRENSLSVRKGFTRLNDGLPDTPYSAYFLRDINGRQWRYAVANSRLYVAPVENPGDNAIWPTVLGTQFAFVVGGSGLSTASDPRPIWADYTLIGLEYKPYIFMADGKTFIKHKAGETTGAETHARRVGIPKPEPLNSVELSDNTETLIEDFNNKLLWTADNSTLSTETAHAGGGNSMGIALPAADDQVGCAYKVMSNAGVYPVIVDLDPADPDGIIEMWIKFEDAESALNCAEIVVAFGISLTLGDITFKTRYEKAIKPSEFEGASQPGSGGRSETYGDSVPQASDDLTYKNTENNLDSGGLLGPLAD